MRGGGGGLCHHNLLAGINQLEGVVILASTNRVDILDQVCWR